MTLVVAVVGDDERAADERSGHCYALTIDIRVARRGLALVHHEVLVRRAVVGDGRPIFAQRCRCHREIRRERPEAGEVRHRSHRIDVLVLGAVCVDWGDGVVVRDPRRGQRVLEAGGARIGQRLIKRSQTGHVTRNRGRAAVDIEVSEGLRARAERVPGQENPIGLRRRLQVHDFTRAVARERHKLQRRRWVVAGDAQVGARRNSVGRSKGDNHLQSAPRRDGGRAGERDTERRGDGDTGDREDCRPLVQKIKSELVAAPHGHRPEVQCLRRERQGRRDGSEPGESGHGPAELVIFPGVGGAVGQAGAQQVAQSVVGVGRHKARGVRDAGEIPVGVVGI